MNDDLNTLCPQPRRLQVGGRTLAITPIRVRELAPFAAALHPLAQACQSLEDLSNLPLLLAEHTGDLLALVAVAARVEPDWLEGLGLDELLDLTEACFEVNADFFQRRLQPRLAQAAQGISALLAAGSSSTPDCAASAAAPLPT